MTPEGAGEDNKMIKKMIAGMLVLSMLICCGNFDYGNVYAVENAVEEVADVQVIESESVAVLADSLSETESPEETEALNETESETVRESENLAETETPSLTETLNETEAPSETESPKETEMPSETESQKESETPGETEAPSEPETKPVVVKVDAPSRISAECISYDQIKVSWSKVKNADSYMIYRKKKGDTSYKKIASTTKTTFTNKKLSCGTIYYYKVKACASKDGQDYLSSLSKVYAYAKTVPSNPVYKVKEARKDSVVVQWNSVVGADGYEIIYEAPGGKHYNYHVGKSRHEYEIKELYTSKIGHVRVRACHGAVKSKSEKHLEIARAVPAISMQSVYVGSDGTSRITWIQDREADGYLIYRKDNKENKWIRIDKVDQTRCIYKDKGLSRPKEYKYRVRGFRRLNGKAVRGLAGSSMQPTLTYSKTYVRNVTKSYVGKSGSGRKMYTFTMGTGTNHMVIVSEIHGYEDNWKKDSVLLIKTAEDLIQYFAERPRLLKDNNYQISVLPMANPDGYYDGYTHNGPGRCTTKRINESARLVNGGLDLNRCFPVGFLPQYSDRYYTGPRPLAAPEAKVIKAFIDDSKGSRKNQFIDMQGWYNQIITNSFASGILYQGLKKYFPSSRPATLGGNGYMASYAKSVGYDAALFEFPWDVTSENAFYSREYDKKFIKAVRYILVNS